MVSKNTFLHCLYEVIAHVWVVLFYDRAVFWGEVWYVFILGWHSKPSVP